MNKQKKNYPLHPSHAEPMYIQISREAFDAMSEELTELRKLVVPTDILKAEIDSLKCELDMYRGIMEGNRTTKDDIAEIRTPTSEVKALRDMNAKEQGEMAELREATRWRKCSEELPEEERQFLCLRQTGHIKILWWSKQLKSFAQYDITHWMPLPKAPEEK